MAEWSPGKLFFLTCYCHLLALLPTLLSARQAYILQLLIEIIIRKFSFISNHLIEGNIPLLLLQPEVVDVETSITGPMYRFM